LKSVYEGRPATVFFSYPTQCGIERDRSRAYNITEFEEKKFDLKYKCTGNRIDVSYMHSKQQDSKKSKIQIGMFFLDLAKSIRSKKMKKY